MTTPAPTLFQPSSQKTASPSSMSPVHCEKITFLAKSPENGAILGQSEEKKHAVIIRENYFFIVKQIQKHKLETKELGELAGRIDKWTRNDKSCKPGKRRLDYITGKMCHCLRKNKNLLKVRQLYLEINEAAEEIELSKNVLITSNMRLVGSIAKRYQDRGLGLADLVQEGCLGLMRAVFRFDYRAGLRFSTYASWWIRQSITRAIPERTLTIKLPAHFLASRNHYNKTFLKLQSSLGRKPTLKEVETECYLPSGKIKTINETAREPMSLEAPIGDDNICLINMLEDKKSSPPGNRLESKELSNHLELILQTLSKREAAVIRLRFGIGEEKEYTLEEIGNRFKVSRERIRQIEQIALNRLRHPSRSDRVKCFMEH